VTENVEATTTGFTFSTNEAVVWPAATVTGFVWNVAAVGLLADKDTVAPCASAGAFNVTVPLSALPPTADVALTESAFATGAATAG
jgi:hypothetical protein